MKNRDILVNSKDNSKMNFRATYSTPSLGEVVFDLKSTSMNNAILFCRRKINASPILIYCEDTKESFLLKKNIQAYKPSPRKNEISINDFEFRFAGYGHYHVTYHSPNNMDKWCTIINDMTIIDNTKNNPNRTKVSLQNLRRLCKKGTRI